MRTTRYTLHDLRPKFQDQNERYNNWYFTAHFAHQGQDCTLKLAITEGSLLGQYAYLSLSREEPRVEEREEVSILRPALTDINLVLPASEISYGETNGRVTVTLGDLTAVCGEDERRIVCTHERLKADLTYTPRSPLFMWGHSDEGLCPVTEHTRVSGRESLSEVTGTLSIDGEQIAVQGRGLFERVWFGQLSFFEIRATDWLYAHFDELVVYLCRTESVDSSGCPFHFETGEAYVVADDTFVITEAIEISPDRWVYLEEARRFIPLEQSWTIRTDAGVLRLQTRASAYPQFIQPPMRMEFLTIDNLSGWGTLFYDTPVAVSGSFRYRDGRTIALSDGVGINEQIRISPL